MRHRVIRIQDFQWKGQRKLFAVLMGILSFKEGRQEQILPDNVTTVAMIKMAWEVHLYN